jgi:hypothetical protein
MRLRLLMLVVILLPACAAQSVGRDSCAAQLEAAWHELDIAKAERFAGTVSYCQRRHEIGVNLAV